MYCKWCGKPLPGPGEPPDRCGLEGRAVRFCERCGTQFDPGEAFCAKCGTPLAGPAPVPNAKYRTDPWAIASIVLAFSWPFLGVIWFAFWVRTQKGFPNFWGPAAVEAIALLCGVIALRRIKRSPQPERGRRLAKLGIRLGIMGAVLGSFLSLWVPYAMKHIDFGGAITQTSATTQTTGPTVTVVTIPPVPRVPVGTTVRVRQTDNFGLTTLTLESWKTPVAYHGVGGGAGWHWAAFLLRICAGPTGSSLSLSSFTLRVIGAIDTIGVVDTGNYSLQPALAFNNIAPNKCVSGYVTGAVTQANFSGGEFGVGVTNPQELYGPLLAFWLLPQ